MSASGVRHYRIFDVVLASDIALPELPPTDQAEAALRVREGLPVGFDPQAFEPVFEWRGPSGHVAATVARQGGEWLFDYPGYARFQLSASGDIHCQPTASCHARTLRHLLITQAIPRYLGSSGRLVVHASAVCLTGGRTAAFLGPSGHGKSTLAASFHRHGARLLADDCILLEPDTEGVRAIGAYPGLRLFPDSLHALFDERQGYTRVTSYTDKQQALLCTAAEPGDPAWHRLDAIFLLADPARPEYPERVEVTPLGGAEALMALLRGTFALDPSEEATLVREFRTAGQAISRGSRVFRLAYPLAHERLADVRQCVTKQLYKLAAAH